MFSLQYFSMSSGIWHTFISLILVHVPCVVPKIPTHKVFYSTWIHQYFCGNEGKVLHNGEMNHMRFCCCICWPALICDVNAWQDSLSMIRKHHICSNKFDCSEISCWLICNPISEEFCIGSLQIFTNKSAFPFASMSIFPKGSEMVLPISNNSQTDNPYVTKKKIQWFDVGLIIIT